MKRKQKRQEEKRKTAQTVIDTIVKYQRCKNRVYKNPFQYRNFKPPVQEIDWQPKSATYDIFNIDTTTPTPTPTPATTNLSDNLDPTVDPKKTAFFLMYLTYNNEKLPKSRRQKVRKLISLVFSSTFGEETKNRNESKETFKKRMYRYRDITRNLLLNFMLSYTTGASVSIPKQYNYWHEQHTTNPANPSPRHFLYVFNKLDENGYITKVANHWYNHSPGSKKGKGTNRTARYVPSNKLIDTITSFFISKKEIDSAIEVEQKYQSPIQIKIGNTVYNKKLNDFNEPGMRRIKSSFRFVENYNFLMNTATVTLNVTPQYADHLNNKHNGYINNLIFSKILEKNEKGNFNINHRDMFRRFVTDYKKGGRFYGTPVQYIPSELRKHIYINGKATVERDYSCLHPTMLYMMNGSFDKKLRPANPYYYSKCNEPEKRKEAKLAFLIMINSKDEKEAVPALRSGFIKRLKYKKGDYRLKDEYIKNLFTVLENHNKPIKEFFYSNIGLTLQNYDSIMAQNIMRRFTLRPIPKPIFCIHDSFIVQKNDEWFLKILMANELEKFNKKCRKSKKMF